MKRFISAVFIILFTIGLISCGGVSAPPVSLPSPVTGRIVVSSADSDGNISVIGEDGSVTADSTVLAINSSSVSFNLPEKILDLVIQKAYAQTDFPAVCSLTGRACALADANGAFELTIPGADGDEIIIVLIDPISGREISDRLTRSVPDNLAPFSGEPISVKLSPDLSELYVLLIGEETEVNRIQTATLSPWSINSGTTDVGGKLGTEMEVAFGRVAVVNKGATSDDVSSLFIATIDPVTQAFSVFSQVDLVGTTTPYILPTDFGLGEDHVVFTSNTTDPSLDFWSIAQDTFQSFVISVTEFGLPDNHIATFALSSGDVLLNSPSGFQNVNIFVTISEFEDPSTGERVQALVIFQKANIDSWLEGGSEPFPDTAVALPSGAIPSDVSVEHGDNSVIITDRGNNAIYIYDLDLNDNGIVQVQGDPLVVTADDIIDPGKIGVGQNPETLESLLFVTLQNGDDTRLDSILTFVPGTSPGTFTTKVLPICLEPTDMAFDATNNYLYVSCLKSKIVARIPVADLIP